MDDSPAPGGPQVPEDAALQARIHRALANVTRVRIFRLLEHNPTDVATLAAATGLHHNTVRAHLKTLELAGLVKRTAAPSGRPGRPSARYRIADPPPVGLEADHTANQALLEILSAALDASADDPADTAQQAGKPVGAARVRDADPPTSVVEALERVTEMLDDFGFAPELVIGADSAKVLLHRCPFDDLALRYGDIVCAAHLGIIRGALAELGATVQTDLQPFVQENLCVTDVHLPPGGQTLPLHQR